MWQLVKLTGLGKKYFCFISWWNLTQKSPKFYQKKLLLWPKGTFFLFHRMWKIKRHIYSDSQEVIDFTWSISTKKKNIPIWKLFFVNEKTLIGIGNYSDWSCIESFFRGKKIHAWSLAEPPNLRSHFLVFH